ncbi:DUF6364 family protein [uncultured Arcticibacterium sp.]|uniref:DUF6364 family protein n=1 Tax=uncultured Arcticibacterium sp. TaxID=2173042 RepID=UPI0030FBFC5F
MTNKLTLSVDMEVISLAKAYTKSTDRSLSNIVENYLRSLVEGEEHVSKIDLINELAGSIDLPEGFDVDESRREYLESKHL